MNKQVAGPAITQDDEQGGSRSASAADNDTPELHFENNEENLNEVGKAPNTAQTERESRLEAHVLTENDPKFFAETEEDEGIQPRLKAALPYSSVHTIQPVRIMKPIMNTEVKN